MKLLPFIKENRVLVAGFTLPLLLVGLLAYAKTIPDRTIPDPQYKAAYMTQGWSGQGQIKTDIDNNGRLTVSYKKHDTPTPETDLPKARIFIYDPATQTNEEIEIKLTEADGTVTVDALPELDKLTLSSKTTAPDDYLFEPYHYRNHSLVTDIFISNRSYNTPVLTKKSRIIRLPAPSIYYSGNIEFVGWITAEGK
ncbi:MAG TPA: hypothetical protein PKI93_02250 [Alphaproteobacteria bacterium]|nr:hypothetical protein [Alphaproteobacteria bacterium]HNS43965.1 hypothetical protein [Alphaproteobacteria bacterium]